MSPGTGMLFLAQADLGGVAGPARLPIEESVPQAASSGNPAWIIIAVVAVVAIGLVVYMRRKTPAVPVSFSASYPNLREAGQALAGFGRAMKGLSILPFLLGIFTAINGGMGGLMAGATMFIVGIAIYAFGLLNAAAGEAAQAVADIAVNTRETASQGRDREAA